ncbi:DUF5692 family protein [Lentimicrobium sp. S6]|uniref:DUF5692 family protein n=1 Tax=Lentimicrobium sp. S6 TaxID=2735872 RepID=UPI001C1329EA|nr:DUF5692 family protein [Lentimicrobium sp. S6]
MMSNIKNLNKSILLGLALILTQWNVLSANQTNLEAADVQIGMYQGVLDGDPGEGGLFYRLNFMEEGMIEITKQFGGNNLKEIKSWEQQGEYISITSKTGDQIHDFDEAKIELLSSKKIKYNKGHHQFYIHKYSGWKTALHWVGMLVLLILLNELFRRYKIPTFAFYIIIPFLVIPLIAYLGYTEVSYWFKWVKLYSVVFAAIWFSFMRYTKLGFAKSARFVAAAFLAINIAEAVGQDFSMGFIANILNAIAGILSIITLTGWKDIHIDNSKEKDLVWPAMTTLWIIAYDIWNFVFVYLNFPGSAANQFLVLLSCTIPSLFIKKGTWLQARAFTLAAWFMYYFISPTAVETHLVPLPRTDFLMLASGVISIVANLILAYVVFKDKWSTKKQLA